MLSGLPLMVQAAFSDSLFFDAFSPFLDGRIAPEVDVGGRDVAETFVVTLVIVILDEGVNRVVMPPQIKGPQK